MNALVIACLGITTSVARPVHAQETRGRTSQSLEPPPLRHYVCYRAPRAPVVDGRLNETSWRLARWTESFVDIVDGNRPAPWKTRVKMLWDDQQLFIGAELEEPHLWATLTQRDTVIYQDSDFEVFIDPDGDTHNYYELEINALGTEWDLFLAKPYRDGGRARTSWDVAGLETAVALDGTLNDPTDEDTRWTVEISIPWAAVAEHAPQGSRPSPGDQWRLNFSRVQWQLEIADSAYRKLVDPATGRTEREENWVWSPQGEINMHMPEMWGIVQFSDSIVGRGRDAVGPDSNATARWALRRIYYAQREYRREHGDYAQNLEQLGFDVPAGESAVTLTMEVSPGSFRADIGDGGVIRWSISEDGRVWRRTGEGSP
jgi:hypothetical protein